MEAIGPIIALATRPARGLLLAALLLAAACGGPPRYDWIGTWRGERNLEAPSGTSEVLRTTLARVEVTLNANGTFDLFEAGIPKDGTVRYADGKAFLKVLNFMGRPISEQGTSAEAMNEEMVLQSVDADTVSYVDPRGFDDAPIELKRLPQPDAPPARKP